MNSSNDAFSDPSIAAAVSGSPTAPSSAEYNPFVITSPTSNPSTPITNVLTSPTKVVQKQIEALRAQQSVLDSAASSSAMGGSTFPSTRHDNSIGKNFPPIPSFCPFGPCFRQDIQMDIPIAYHKWASYCFYLCLLLQLSMITNFCALFFYLIGNASLAWVDFVLSLMWLLVIGPCAYVSWFRPIYNAFRDDSSMNFMLFFFMFFIHIVFTLLMLIGIPRWGFAGFALMIKIISMRGLIMKLSGIIAIITTILFACTMLSSFYLLYKVRSLYGASNASLGRAQHELAGAFWSNEQTRRAAATIMRQSAASAATAASSSNVFP